ncbi:MAG: NACHT domain-containing protein [Anaerolineales bacterium]
MVRQWVEDMLENSLHGAVPIALGKQAQAGAVQHPWEMLIATPHQPDRLISPDQPMLEVFDEMQRTLLILGAPGSGKTTTLLELARDLLTRAEADPTQPIPVFFNLSSWAERRPPLVAWMAEELTAKYHIPRQLGRRWLDTYTVLPLLDGLDEVRVEQREACVEAINTYRKTYGLAGLVVCSRSEAYGALTKKLQLSGAILIQPLTEQQIARWLSRASERLAASWAALEKDAVFREMAHTPLMLWIMSVAGEAIPMTALPAAQANTVDAYRNHLLAAYVERMFARPGRTRNELYPRTQTLHRLTWLARRMTQHGQSIFLIEHLQPSWLAGRAGRWAYAVASRVFVSLLLGATIGIGYALSTSATPVFVNDLEMPPFLSAAILALIAALVIGPPIGVIAGLTCALRFEWNADRPAGLPTFAQRAFNVLIAGLGPGLAIAVLYFIFGLVVGSARAPDLLSRFLLILWQVPLVTLLFSIPFGVIFGSKNSGRDARFDIPIVEALSWSWTTAVRGAIAGGMGGLFVGLGVGVLLAMVSLLRFDFSRSPFPLPAIVLSYLCVCGGPTALIGAGLFGLIGGLQSKTAGQKISFNQGIRQSAKNCVVGTVVFTIGGSLLMAIPGLLSSWITAQSSGRWDPFMLLIPLSYSPILGAMGALYYGGLAVIQHFTLRALLLVEGRLPARPVRFFDYCAERILLRKVGGGYIFVHRLVQDYFTGLEADKGQRIEV